MTTEDIIKALRDIDGVGGSFVVGEDGLIITEDMSADFVMETLGEVGSRIWRLLDGWSVEVAETECVLRFSKSRLYVKGIGGAVLCILLNGPVHMAALRTAVQLVGKRLSRMQAAAASQASVSGLVFSGDAASSRVASGPALPGARYQAGGLDPRSKRIRIFRGQRFEY